MKILELIKDPAISELRNEVNLFVEDVLVDYLKDIENARSLPNYFNAKDIHDAVWGTIALSPIEVIIIDSPLIQRLRRIMHLGLAGLLFPGAEYSRFEHTLGVFYVADKISSKVKAESLYPLNELCPNQLCRLAALFHDSGHLLCSHASEAFFQSPRFSRYDLVDKATSLFTDYAGKSIGFSELLSVLIVVSPKVIELIEKAWVYSDNKSLKNGGEEIAEHLAALIIGVPTHLWQLPFHGVISGPIDADKCDYLARDSHRTGVPVAIDLYRVIQKFNLIEGVPVDWGSFWIDKRHPEQKESYLLGITLSAVKSVEEILISRQLMYEKIYFHHKIMTAEAMFRRALYFLDQSGFKNISNFRFALQLTDHDIISNTPEHFIPSISKNIDEAYPLKEKPFRIACKILKDLMNRKLLKRSCAIFTESNPANNNKNNNESGYERIKLFSLVELASSQGEAGNFLRDIFKHVSVEAQDNFIDSVVKEIKNLLIYLNKIEFESEDIECEILPVSYPQLNSDGFDIPLQIGNRLGYYNDIFQGDSWNNSRNTNYFYHYIAGPSSIRLEVFLAVEHVLFKEYKLLLEQGASDLAKIDIDQIELIKKELYEKGYYNKSLPLISDKMIWSQDEIKKISKLVKKFSYYEGPLGYKIWDTSHITSFLKQFVGLTESIKEQQLLLSGLIILLDNIHILNRFEIVEAFNNNFKNIAQKFDCLPWEMSYCITGNEKDSAAHITYYFNDLDRLYGKKLFTGHLNKILSGREDRLDIPTIFFDDACCSGSQIISIFQEICDVPIDKRMSRESHNLTLNSRQKKALRNSKIVLCFCYAMSENIANIKETITNLGFDIDVITDREFPNKFFESTEYRPFTSYEQKEIVKKALTEVGIELLLSTKKKGNEFKYGWSQERINNSALGYGDAQQCIILPWNTPTYTLTALWAHGNFRGAEWHPLFPRQSKD